MILMSLFATWTSSAQDLSVCDGKGREQCLWALACAKDPKNPNKVIPSDCAQHYQEPEPPPKPEPVATTPPPKKEKSPLEKLYYIDADEDEQVRIIDERSRRQAERAVNSEESKDTTPKKPEEQKPIPLPDSF